MSRKSAQMTRTWTSELKANDQGNLFVIFGEPDIEAREENDGQLRVKICGIDIFDPTTGEIRSDEPDSIACWMLDTDYYHGNFFVRHALLPRPEHPQQGAEKPA
jgi:adenine-specific DNA-methyltransferase